jgi:hypothetical protein
MRPAFARFGVRHAAVAACLVASVTAPPARAQDTERFRVSAFTSYGLERFHSIGADTVGHSLERSPESGLAVDFRAIDLPVGKGPKPSLNLTAELASSTRVLGPMWPGQRVAEYEVIGLTSGVMFEFPLEAFLKGNSGVAMRVGWRGGYVISATTDNGFTSSSKARFEFVRTTGALEGSLIGVGHGYDEAFGWDAAHGRTDARVVVQGRLLGRSVGAPAAAPRPGAKAPAKPAAKPEIQRLVWLFTDVAIDTDGGLGADGLRARAGVGFDVSAFLSAAFAHP